LQELCHFLHLAVQPLGGSFEQRIDFDPRQIIELQIKQIV